ncbi:hypothetical protein SAMN05444285_13310 [Draconibacterium orientale]|jgi:hypothetical protein|uniref:Uncharacterized protein n=1 Tax=Draconibacterium orientale TaxID=1168034 RepID=A0A1I0ILI6_9BACT|nr:hypothetical protein SAMN05444285_13310 [Draconibacterium orientale]
MNQGKSYIALTDDAKRFRGFAPNRTTGSAHTIDVCKGYDSYYINEQG